MCGVHILLLGWALAGVAVLERGATSRGRRVRFDRTVRGSPVRLEPTRADSCDRGGRLFPEPFADLSKLVAMAQTGETRIQLCGRLVVRLDGRRVEDALPGAKGQLLFAYLVLNRLRRIDRDELLIAVYGEEATPDHHPRLSVLLSKLRRVIGPELLAGRAQLELVLPADAFVDVEAALEALHRAESHVAAGEWAEAWGPSGIAYHVASRRCSRATTALAGRVAATPRRRPAARARVLRGGEARPRRPDTAAGRGVRAPADRAGPVPRDRLPDPDGGARARAGTSPRRCASTTACASCSATSSGSRPARPCRASTDACSARRTTTV